MKVWKVDSYSLEDLAKDAARQGVAIDLVLAFLLNMYETLGVQICNVFFADGAYKIVYSEEDSEKDKSSDMPLYSMFDSKNKNNLN